MTKAEREEIAHNFADAQLAIFDDSERSQGMEYMRCYIARLLSNVLFDPDKLVETKEWLRKCKVEK
jgi:hypothetical protein